MSSAGEAWIARAPERPGTASETVPRAPAVVARFGEDRGDMLLGKRREEVLAAAGLTD